MESKLILLLNKTMKQHTVNTFFVSSVFAFYAVYFCFVSCRYLFVFLLKIILSSNSFFDVFKQVKNNKFQLKKKKIISLSLSYKHQCNYKIKKCFLQMKSFLSRLLSSIFFLYFNLFIEIFVWKCASA
jgi:hypothetical protein